LRALTATLTATERSAIGGVPSTDRCKELRSGPRAVASSADRTVRFGQLGGRSRDAYGVAIERLVLVHGSVRNGDFAWAAQEELAASFELVVLNRSGPADSARGSR
jgi:hypothetical protein